MNYSIGNFLKELRESSHLTQQELADKISISRQSISKWELGKSLPDHIMLVKLSKIFNVSIEEILLGERKKMEEVVVELYNSNRKKSKIIRVNFIFLIMLTLTFLIYYFLSEFNKTKVYFISAKNDNFNISNGIFLKTKEKIFMIPGIIDNKNNKNIKGYELIIKDKKINQSIIKINDLAKILISNRNSKELFDFHRVEEQIKNMYLRVYNDTTYEDIKLNFILSYKNNRIIYNNKVLDEKNIAEIPTENDNLIITMLKKFNEENDYLFKSYDFEKHKLSYKYLKKDNVLIIEKIINNKMQEKWEYDLLKNQLLYTSFKNDIDRKECTLDDYEYYIFKENIKIITGNN